MKWYQNPEIFFGHQMGPEQTLRRETWTDRREISVRVSFFFNKIQNVTFWGPGPTKTKKTPLRGTHHNRPRIWKKNHIHNPIQ